MIFFHISQNLPNHGEVNLFDRKTADSCPSAGGISHSPFCALRRATVGPSALPLIALKDHSLLPELSSLLQPSSWESCAFFSFNAWLISSHVFTSPFSTKMQHKMRVHPCKYQTPSMKTTNSRYLVQWQGSLYCCCWCWNLIRLFHYPQELH